MTDDKKIKIGKYEYIICKDEEQKEYLYRYDVDDGIGIKIKFSDDVCNSKHIIIKMLTKQYIDEILISNK